MHRFERPLELPIRLRRLCRFYCPLALLICFLLAHDAPAATIKVGLRDGRSFAGEVDAATNVSELWLRVDRPGMRFRRPLAWDQVQTVRTDDQTLSAAEFRTLVQTGGWAIDTPPSPAQVAANSGDPFRDEADELPPPAKAATRSGGVTAWPEPLAASPRVATLRVAASLANWDKDVEPDGLIVNVLPLDTDGDPIRARGTLEFELIGEPRMFQNGAWPTIEIGRWTVSLTPEQCGAQGAVFRLPFQALQPEFDLKLADCGILHARLSVPGQGTFDESVDNVRLRRASPQRDLWEQLEGDRFAPGENTGRGVELRPAGLLPAY